MYERLMLSEKMYKLKYPKFAAIYNVDIFNGNAQFGETSNKKYWCLCGKFGITTDKAEKRIFSCTNIKLNNKLNCSIFGGEIFFYQNEQKKIHIDKLTKGKDIDTIYTICKDNKYSPYIERVIKRYIRRELKKRYIVEV